MSVINKIIWLACLFKSAAFIAVSYVVVGHTQWLSVCTTVVGCMIMLTPVGSMCCCVVMHRIEESYLRNIRRRGSGSCSHSFCVSMVSETWLLNNEYKWMYGSLVYILEIIQCLLSVEGINVNAISKAGESPLDIAEKFENVEIGSVLRAAGAIQAKDHVNPLNPANQLKQAVSDIKHDVQSQLQQTQQTRAGVHKIAKKLKKLYISGLNNAINNGTLVALLIATVAFAAIFTVPGQYADSEKDGVLLGQANIANDAAFLIFFVCDSVALLISLAVVVVQTSVVVMEEKAKRQLVFVINKLMWLACLFISAAVISLSYVVVGRHSLWLAMYVTVVGGVIMLTTVGSNFYFVVRHRIEESSMRNIRRASESRSLSLSLSIVSEPELLKNEYKRIYEV